jgi:Transposase DDE domain group 1
MKLKNLDCFKVSTTKAAVTSFGGLPLVLGMARSLGLETGLNRVLSALKKRERGYTPAESGFTLMGILQAGGRALDDVRLLSGDEGLRALWGAIPVANTLGEFLRRFTATMVYRLGALVLATGIQVIERLGFKSITIDIDAFMLESQKDGVQMNYDGLWGFEPVVCSCAELRMPLAGLFRPGNASPMANLRGLLSRVIGALKKTIPDLKILVRSDSAAYQAGVIGECQRAGVDFTITVRKDEAVMTTIRAIAQTSWRSYAHAAYPGRQTEITETVHAFGDKDVAAFRMIVIRWPKAQINFMDIDYFDYHALAVSREGTPAELAVQFHRNRQDKSENMNKELIGGFGLSKLPCQETLANAAYFQLAMVSHIVFVAFKELALPQDWKHKTIETMRFEMIRLAGMVSRRARSLWLKLPAAYPYLKIFEEARWATLGAAVWVT